VITDVLIEPSSGEFDVAAIEAWLQALPHTARDARDTYVFMVASDEDEMEAAKRARDDDPTRFPTSLLLFRVRPQRVWISYRSADPTPARRFVEWLRSRYPDLRFMDEETNDLTSAVTGSLDFLFGTAGAT
jgi:hypothetical protein